MSVTFRLSKTPYVRKEEVFDKESFWFDVPEDGWTEINMSNINARAILDLLGIESYDLCGAISVASCKDLIDKLDSIKDQFTSNSVRFGNIYLQGRSEDYVLDRVESFKRLFNHAIETNDEVIFS
jgi:hypothetical protein